jgi:D-beta-D-heptose 7-phosphate kinase/D-beta-D-heptose 1-phosphate adenosyltransferase
MKIWVNGSFDVIHIGHIRLLELASQYGEVRVGIDSDERIKELKGNNRPYNNQDIRKEFLESIRYVKKVIIFNSNDELEDSIKKYEPDIMVIGDDYKYKPIIGIEYIKKVVFFEKVKDVSTSKILSHEKNNSNRGTL